MTTNTPIFTTTAWTGNKQEREFVFSADTDEQRNVHFYKTPSVESFTTTAYGAGDQLLTSVSRTIVPSVARTTITGSALEPNEWEIMYRDGRAVAQSVQTSFWQKHRVAILSAAAAGIIVAVALAILCWPASFALGIGGLTALSLGAKIGIVSGGSVGASTLSAALVELLRKKDEETERSELFFKNYCNKVEKKT